MNAKIRSYHWTAALKDAFLETLAKTGSVRRAAAAVEKSPRAAYNLRRRKEGADFALAWDAALLVAHERIGDDLAGYALQPVEAIGTPHPVTGRLRWRRVDPMLGRGMAPTLLARLDRSYDRIVHDPRRAQVVRRIMCELWQNSAIFSGPIGMRRRLFFHDAALYKPRRQPPPIREGSIRQSEFFGLCKPPVPVQGRG